LNILDGVTATTAELNILDGVTATTAELNILDGVTATADELNVLDGVTATTAELNVLDGVDTTLTPDFLANPTNYLDPDNRIINGAFDFWQRGTSSSTQDAYSSADRWFNGASGGTVTMSRSAFAVGNTLGTNSPKFYLVQSVSGQSLSTHRAHAIQRIEDVRSYAGQTITVLGWAVRLSGSGNMAVNLQQNFGTGGSPSAEVILDGQQIALIGSGMTPFAVTFTVPSITGKTLGSDNNSILVLNFWSSAGSTFDARTDGLGLQTIGLGLWGIHIKRGTHTADATEAYRAPELGPELARCQRYFEILGVISASNGLFVNGYTFKAEKRASPTLSLVSGGLSGGAFSAISEKPTSGIIQVTNSTAGTGATISADAEL
jgi:hypothetical protein